MNTFVALSGGIDSTALALIEENADLVFTDTGWEFEHIYEHLDRIEQTTGRNITRVKHPLYPGGLPEYIRLHKYMPNHGARYCTRVFKIESYNLWLCGINNRADYDRYEAARNELAPARRKSKSSIDRTADVEAAKHAGLTPRVPATMMIGLRADEPAEARVGNLTIMPGLSIRYPLRERGLVRIDVTRICLENDLLPRYPVYTIRGGCKGCFYKRRSEVAAMHTLTPDVMNELQLLEESVQDERGQFFHMFASIGMSIREFRARHDAQDQLFTTEEIYGDAMRREDMGVACGLFCQR